jgi:hypothetical protein
MGNVEITVAQRCLEYAQPGYLQHFFFSAAPPAAETLTLSAVAAVAPLAAGVVALCCASIFALICRVSA